VAAVFLRLGVTAFGGPAAHISLMQEELVRRRKWVDEQEYLDLVAAANLVPGPNSTELALHLGLRRAGWAGFLAAGACFILPAAILVTAFAWLYVRFGSLPPVSGLLHGVEPVILVIILSALLALRPRALKDPLTIAIAAAAAIAGFLATAEILILLTGGLAAVVGRRLPVRGGDAPPQPAVGVHAPAAAALLAMAAAVPFSLDRLFLSFLKIGSVLYGSGYVLVAFLESEFVERLGWITQQQLLDAVAVGQFTPGPLFTTATFIGFILAGIPGAVVATIGIFLPAFLFVAISHPLVPRMRRSALFSALLDGVIAASLGLMAAVLAELALGSLRDPLSIVIAVVAGVLILRYRINAMWLIAAGAAAGLLAALV
jgi:chromate transporter